MASVNSSSRPVAAVPLSLPPCEQLKVARRGIAWCHLSHGPVPLQEGKLGNSSVGFCFAKVALQCEEPQKMERRFTGVWEATSISVAHVSAHQTISKLGSWETEAQRG